MKRILVTGGGSGFLGKTISKYLSKDQQVITLGRNNSDINIDLALGIPILPNVDIVIHTAGKAHLNPNSDLDKQEFFNINVNGTKNLLKALESSLIPKSFIFISSVAVYGIESGEGIDESTPLAACDAYGSSKVKAEQVVSDWCKQNNVICTILRLPLIAGPNPPGNLRSMINGIKKGYYFNIAGGRARKSMVLADDVAKIIPAAGEKGGIYNLTDGYHPSFAELSKKMAQQLQKKEPANIPMWVAVVMAKVGDLLGHRSPIDTNKLRKIIYNLSFDDSKARRDIGWRPQRVLDYFKIA
jgi:nucleoside-diphosphate-sugar epimerase